MAWLLLGAKLKSNLKYSLLFFCQKCFKCFWTCKSFWRLAWFWNVVNFQVKVVCDHFSLFKSGQMKTGSLKQLWWPKNEAFVVNQGDESWTSRNKTNAMPTVYLRKRCSGSSGGQNCRSSLYQYLPLGLEGIWLLSEGDCNGSITLGRYQNKIADRVCPTGKRDSAYTNVSTK